MNRSGSCAAAWTALVAAACLWTAAVTAQDAAVAQSRYGAPVNVDSFAYRRDIAAGAPGLAELRLDAAALAHSRTEFADLRIVSADGRQVPYLIRQETEPLSIQLPALEKDSNRYVVRLPYAHLPSARLVITTTARVFERELWLEAGPGEDRADAGGKVIGTSWWSHADPETAAPALTFDVPSLRAARLYLRINEGDNSPLPLGRPTLLLPAYCVRFVRPTAAALQLIYGNREVEQPRYDLALVARRLLDSPAEPVAIGPERQAAAPAVGAGLLFWSALAFAVIVLFALIVRLLRNPGRPGA